MDEIRGLGIEGDAHLAGTVLRESFEIRCRALGADDWRAAEAANLLGACLAASGRFAEAEPLLTEGLPILIRRRGLGDRRARQAVERTVDLYQRWGREAEATRYRQALRTGELG
ncbi:MAG: tetratricopeptide repeat protein [Acidobacteriota bacterium]